MSVKYSIAELKKKKDTLMGTLRKLLQKVLGLTVVGTLLPHIFICTQETENTFGPRIIKTVDQLTEEYENVIVMCSKSGKLTKEHFIEYLEKVLKP